MSSFQDRWPVLEEISRDLRWVWSHEGDDLWRRIDSDLWERTHNPWLILQNIGRADLIKRFDDEALRLNFEAFVKTREEYLATKGHYFEKVTSAGLRGIAYFSMEFGLGAALPLYAGGLGVLAGDFLKTASDLDVPVVGIGLLYQEGYFRQALDAAGKQMEYYPYNEPATLPIQRVLKSDGSPLRIEMQLPGRISSLRVWRATVGRRLLYLLDSNDPLNSSCDRGITAKLYPQDPETRFVQQLVLGVAGWRLVELLHPDINICHMNEGHTAFAALERACLFAAKHSVGLDQSLWITRAGNAFTTHTSVAAAFDRYSSAIVTKYLKVLNDKVSHPERLNEVIRLGRADPTNESEPFNMAYFAHRSAAITIGVSRLHGQVSRKIFQPLYPRWPQDEVPISYVTNGVHMPTWDSKEADQVWTDCCGKDRWRSQKNLAAGIIAGPDDTLWIMRAKGRASLVEHARRHIAAQLEAKGCPREVVSAAASALDPNVLTIGFARRFTEYKRPNLLLLRPDRLARLLLNQLRPVQLILAGKADPNDGLGKEMLRQWTEFATGQCRGRVVILEDYDLDVAQHLAEGVDVWINTPRRLLEACGTSGMKVLVNGGLNCSVMDGWWDEAFSSDVGWAFGQDREEADNDEKDADNLLNILETKIIAEFYDRDHFGLPRRWIERVRTSMAKLTSRFSTVRMMDDHVTNIYLPLAESFDLRAADGLHSSAQWTELVHGLQECWSQIRIRSPHFDREGNALKVSVSVYLARLDPSSISVEMFADADRTNPAICVPLELLGAAIGAKGEFVFGGMLPDDREDSDFTVRVQPKTSKAFLPVEAPYIAWQR